jgi:hypothetical protein
VREYAPLVVDPARVSLKRWLRRQLRAPLDVHERLEAAVENDDPDEVRRLLARWKEFSPSQRRYVEEVLAAWDRERAAAGLSSRQAPVD